MLVIGYSLELGRLVLGCSISSWFPHLCGKNSIRVYPCPSVVYHPSFFIKKHPPNTPCTSCARLFAIFETSHLNQTPVFIGFFSPQKYFQKNAISVTITVTKSKKCD